MGRELEMHNGEVKDVSDEQAVAHYKRTGSVLPGHGDTIAAFRAGDLDAEVSDP